MNQDPYTQCEKNFRKKDKEFRKKAEEIWKEFQKGPDPKREKQVNSYGKKP